MGGQGRQLSVFTVRRYRHPSIRRSHQDTKSSTKVGCWIRPFQIIHWRRRDAGNRYRSDDPTGTHLTEHGSGRPILRYSGCDKSGHRIYKIWRRKIQCVELVDAGYAQLTTNKNRTSKSKNLIDNTVNDILLFKFQGPTQAALRDTAEIVKRVAERYGGEGFEVARTQNHADQMWSSVMHAKMKEGVKISATDVCVPLSNLPRLIVETRKDIEKEGLRSTIRVRLGDGNVLAVIQYTTDEEKGKARRVLDRVVRRAIKLEGTCTGEHGIGSVKRSYLVDDGREYSCLDEGYQKGG